MPTLDRCRRKRSPAGCRLLTGLFLLLCAQLPAPARAGVPSQETAAICDRVTRIAARESRVPLAVLQAIARTESGRRLAREFTPWPWTVNMEGTGHWFETADEMLAFVETRRAGGARSFDLGCFQVNFHWHGNAFASIAEMAEPLANARYAAGLLAGLHAELGDWTLAAGAYHSRRPERAQAYREKFSRHYRTLLAKAAGRGTDPPEAAVLATRPARPEAANGYPLLVDSAAATRSTASLVPLARHPPRPPGAGLLPAGALAGLPGLPGGDP